MIGLIGCGHWGSKILRDLTALGCTVGVVARSDESVSRARAGDAAVVWDSIDDMAEVEGIVVATPISTHADVLEAVLSCGVPVFTEKPIAPDVDETRRLVARAPNQLFVMDKWRYHRGVEAIRDLVSSGRYGDLRRLRICFTSWSQRHDDVDGAWVLLPHVISIILEVAGEIPAIASTSGWITGRGGEVDLTATFGAGGRYAVEVSTMRPVYERSITAQFDEASVVLGGGYDEHLTVLRYGEPLDGAASLPIEPAMPLYDELAAFVGHLAGGPPPRSSAQEGLAIVEAVTDVRSRLSGGRSS